MSANREKVVSRVLLPTLRPQFLTVSPQRWCFLRKTPFLNSSCRQQRAKPTRANGLASELKDVMTMGNEANAIVAQALAVQAVRALFDEVQAVTPINLAYAPAGCWSSETSGGQTEIVMAPTSRPASSLVHELLHARLKIRGYRQYSTLGTMDDEPQLLKYANEALDNELQHHNVSAIP